MAGSSFGKSFRVTTFGESHGAALGAIVDGVPAGIPLSEEDIQKYLDRRRPGTSTVTTSRNESDKCRIYSGVFGGLTMMNLQSHTDLDMPISATIQSTDSETTAAAEEARAERP